MRFVRTPFLLFDAISPRCIPQPFFEFAPLSEPAAAIRARRIRPNFAQRRSQPVALAALLAPLLTDQRQRSLTEPPDGIRVGSITGRCYEPYEATEGRRHEFVVCR